MEWAELVASVELVEWVELENRAALAAWVGLAEPGNPAVSAVLEV